MSSQEPGTAIWAHVVLSHQGHAIDPNDASYDHQMVTHRTYCMTKRAMVRPPREAVSLLGGREGGGNSWWPLLGGGGMSDDGGVTPRKDDDNGAISGTNNDDSHGIGSEQREARRSDEYEALLWKPTLDLRMVSQVLGGSLCTLSAP